MLNGYSLMVPTSRCTKTAQGLLQKRRQVIAKPRQNSPCRCRLYAPNAFRITGREVHHSAKVSALINDSISENGLSQTIAFKCSSDNPRAYQAAAR